MLIGLVIGTVIGSYCSGIPSLSWLDYGKVFGITSPMVLDLGVFVLTLGLTIKHYRHYYFICHLPAAVALINRRLFVGKMAEIFCRKCKERF